VLEKFRGRPKEDYSSSKGYNCLHCLIPCGQLHVFQNVSIGDGSYAKMCGCEFIGVMAVANECITVEIVEIETKLLARLQHPNVVNFIGLGGIVLELMSKDLKGYLNEKKMKMKLSIGVRPLSLLEAIHIM